MKYKVLKVSGIAFSLFLISIILGATVPFISFKEVNDNFKNDFSTDKFFSDTIGVDRATAVETNQFLNQTIYFS